MSKQNLEMTRLAGRARIYALRVKWMAERTQARIEAAFPGCTRVQADQAAAARTPAMARVLLKRAAWRAEQVRLELLRGRQK